MNVHMEAKLAFSTVVRIITCLYFFTGRENLLSTNYIILHCSQFLVLVILYNTREL